MPRSDSHAVGIRILLLDDSAMLRTLLAQLLEDLDFVESVVQVDDVASALYAMRAAPFDFAILDLNIPGFDTVKNGIDLARVVKTNHPGTQVALLSALADTYDSDAGIAAGADRFYDKGEFDGLLDWITESARTA